MEIQPELANLLFGYDPPHRPPKKRKLETFAKAFGCTPREKLLDQATILLESILEDLQPPPKVGKPDGYDGDGGDDDGDDGGGGGGGSEGLARGW